MAADLKFALAGLVVGSLVGFSGMGGGSVMTPLLIVLGLPAPKAVGTDLIYSALTKSLGTAAHARRGHVDWAVALWLAVGSVPALIAGVLTITLLRHQMGSDVNNLLQQVLGGMLVVVGTVFVIRICVQRTPSIRLPHSSPVEMTKRRKVLAVSIGLVGGYGVGLTSIGSGTLFALMLMLSFPLIAPRVVGTRPVPRDPARLGGGACACGRRERPVRHRRSASDRVASRRPLRCAVHRTDSGETGARRARRDSRAERRAAALNWRRPCRRVPGRTADRGTKE